ncbi:MAG: type II toxin-antitoxin system RnlB family antitoxin [Clostridiales bacterium]|nr:type II toxin-antitoxin system RnlB family antitoxin [Clostridiales bacterium]
MSDYELLNINQKYKYVVIATSYVNPVDELYNIENDLRQQEFIGQVVFDLLLCNGITDNRYIEVYFNGNTFDINQSKILNDIDIETKKIIYSFYISHINMLEYSSLPKAQQFLLKKGVLM